MTLRTLAEWLSWQETLHPNTIDLGLERLTRVLVRLQWRRPVCPIVTVGGTNGKGSCVALLDSIWSAAGHRVGTFTSPHLVRYNERIRIAGREISDASLVAAFERIDAARGDISLTFFEFNTLAALLVFETAGLDVIVLEVGLGGRLDAVNCVAADIAVVSSIALDHCEWLGADVESIAREKAGIFRPGCVAVFGSRSMPRAIGAEAQRVGALLRRLGSDFDYNVTGASWVWRGTQRQYAQLPPPALAGAMQFDNAAAVLTVVDELSYRLPLSRIAIDAGLRTVRLLGRFQVVNVFDSEWLLDVAHNPAAAETLARNLSGRPCGGRTIAVCGMFADKDVRGVVAALVKQIDLWVVASVSGSRALAADALAHIVQDAGGAVASVARDVAAACEQAKLQARQGDRVLVFGSFYTVGPALQWLNAHSVS